jgi:hypothetical protein
VGDGIAHFDGSMWSMVEMAATTNHLMWVAGTDKNDVWAVGPRHILHWDGSQWTDIPSGVGQDINAIWPASATEVWAVGGGGHILHGNANGLKPVASGTTHILYSVWGTSSSDIWAGGEEGVLLHYGVAAPGSAVMPPPMTSPDAGRTCNPQGYGCMKLPCCPPYQCVRISGNITACE